MGAWMNYLDSVGGYQTDGEGNVIPGSRWTWEQRAAGTEAWKRAVTYQTCGKEKLFCFCGQLYCPECEDHVHMIFIPSRRSIREGIEESEAAAAAIRAAIPEINKFVVEAAQFACSPEGHKPGSGAMGQLKAAVAAYNEAQGQQE